MSTIEKEREIQCQFAWWRDNILIGSENPCSLWTVKGEPTGITNIIAFVDGDEKIILRLCGLDEYEFCLDLVMLHNNQILRFLKDD